MLGHHFRARDDTDLVERGCTQRGHAFVLELRKSNGIRDCICRYVCPYEAAYTPGPHQCPAPVLASVSCVSTKVGTEMQGVCGVEREDEKQDVMPRI